MTKILISHYFDKDGNCLVCGINHARGDKCEIEITPPKKGGKQG